MIRFDQFMAQANAAYYAAKNPFADFVTAPEMTQVFGEVLGAWAKITWKLMGAPETLVLAEAGPGRGTLMADALRAFPRPEIHLIETSARLRAEQAKRLPNAIWHDALATVPPGPMILIANEFLDALPVRQFVRRETGWMERHVEAGAYVEIPSNFTSDDPVGSVHEINEAAQTFVADLARRHAVALLIDYGAATGAPAETVQAIAGGKYADPLQNPGQADITAHVDFAALAATARSAGAAVQGPIMQNRFLTALGLFQRSDMLAQTTPALSETLRRAARRLTAPEAMGSLFKVMAIAPNNFPALPGFEA
jgi:NADH dehydrogenase [ubiquinone] 1 alpha subcomplex assembly factor 7